MVRPNLTPLVIAGPTGSGKSALAIKLALKHNGEIICADSRQFYKFMAIGTAAPTTDELKLVPHHGYQSLDPLNSKIDAGFFLDFAHKKITEIQALNKRPILVGGTGFYLRALRYGIDDVPRSDPQIICILEEQCLNFGLPSLYKKLQELDPQAALNIDKNDKFRIIRALEIMSQTKQSLTSLRKSFYNKKPVLKAYWLYKKPPRSELLITLKNRIDYIFATGLIKEAQELREKLQASHWALDVMGFKEALMYVDKLLDLATAKERAFIRHRQYAKRQYTWFNAEKFYRLVY